MILLLIVFAIIIAAWLIKSQLERNHRETLRMINPERAAEFERKEARLARFDWMVLAIIVGIVIAFCFAGKAFIEANRHPTKTEARP